MTGAVPCFILVPLSGRRFHQLHLCFGLSPQISCLCFTPLSQKAVTIPNNNPAFPSGIRIPSRGTLSSRILLLRHHPGAGSLHPTGLGPRWMWIGLLQIEITQTMAAIWVERKILRQVLSECGELIAYIFPQ